MGLIFWWLLLIWLVFIGGYWLVRWWLLRRKKKLAHLAVPIAHSKRLTDLPEYKKALRQYYLFVRWATGLLSVALLAAIIQSARPANISIISPAQESRDIMLCLDASGSMLRVDTVLINRFSTLVSDFKGQRFGLTLFNSSAVNVIPLNDNYQLTVSQLQKFGTAFQVQKGAEFTLLTSGTLAGFNNGTSLVSDGLTACIDHLGTNTQHRSQSVILATDNEMNGTPLITMDQATGLAKRDNIRVYAIDPGAADTARASDHAQLKTDALATGGEYFALDDRSSISDIISAISKQESSYFSGTPQVATADNPKPLFYVLLFTVVGSMALIWRLEA